MWFQSERLPFRVARFFLVQLIKTWKKILNDQKYTKCVQNIPNGRKIDQKTLTLTNILHCKTQQNLAKLGFFGLKMYHLATLLPFIHAFVPTMSDRHLLLLLRSFVDLQITDHRNVDIQKLPTIEMPTFKNVEKK
jgi:hypothetical protein